MKKQKGNGVSRSRNAKLEVVFVDGYTDWRDLLLGMWWNCCCLSSLENHPLLKRQDEVDFPWEKGWISRFFWLRKIFLPTWRVVCRGWTIFHEPLCCDKNLRNSSGRLPPSFPHSKISGKYPPPMFFSGCSGRCFHVPIRFCWAAPPTNPRTSPTRRTSCWTSCSKTSEHVGVMRYTVNHLGALEK